MNPLEALRLEKKKREWASWVKTEYSRMKHARAPIERQWYINLAFVGGKQNIGVLSTPASNLGYALRVPKAPPWRVRSVTNKCRVVIRTEIAKLTAQRPIPIVLPQSTEDEDYSAARVGEQLLKTEFINPKFSQVFRNWVWWGSVTGCAYMKSYYDKYTPDNSGQPGKVCIENVTPFHVYVPDLLVTDIEDEPYVFNVFTKTPNWVEATFGFKPNADSISTDGILEHSFLNLTGLQEKKKDSVTVYEVWIKPGGHPDFPEGGLLTVIGDKVAQYVPSLKLANPSNQYPFYKYDGLTTGGFYGDSMLVDFIPLQKEYNRTRSQIIEAKNLTSKPKFMAPRGSINPRQITSEPGQIILYEPAFGQAPTPVTPPSLPNYVLEELERIQRDMDDISGQHEISRGSTPGQVTAATAISYLQEQDDSKLSYQFANIEEAISKLGSHYLKYVAVYWDAPRLLRIVGSEGLIEAMHWKGSDLRGNTDVQVMAGSSLPYSKAARQAFVMDLMKLGLIPPQQGLEMLDIGNIDKILEDFLIDKRQAQRENLRMSQMDPQLAAQMVQPEPVTDEQGNPLSDPNTGEPLTVPPQPPLPPNSYDNHAVHIALHNQFRKTQQFEMLPDPIKVVFELHVQGHNMALMLPSQMGPYGIEQPPPGQPVGEDGQPADQSADQSVEEAPTNEGAPSNGE